MRVPSPQECGLPEKFSRWRPAQEQALHVLLTNPARVICLSMPTGSGKSPVVVAYSLLSKRATAIATATRGLQDQYMEDFAEIGMVDLRGRRNYTCGMRDEFTCEEGYHARCPLKGSVQCPSSQAEIRSAASHLVVTNYDKWTTSRKFGMGMEHFQQVIFDEGHEAPDALSRAMQVDLNAREIEETLGLSFPSHRESLEVWKAWAVIAKKEAYAQYRLAQSRLAATTEPKASWVRHFGHMRHLTRRLGIVATLRPQDWVVDEREKGYQFDPIRPARYAEAALLLRLPKIIIVSATIRPKTLWMIGVAKEKSHFQEFDSDFDPKDCPVYWVPTMRVDKNAKDLSPLWIKVDQVLARRRDRKGIIHTISYVRQQAVAQASRFFSSMILNIKGDAPTEIVDRFKLSAPGTILVSPSVGAGYDFPGPACEFQIMCKIPFQDGRSKIVKARQEDDKEYGPYMAMQGLVQAFGRGARFRGDRCENFIFDDHIAWFLPRYRHLAPRSFHLVFREVGLLPAPPAPMGKGDRIILAR
jgi:Rad3-related DNA helicase